MITYTYDLDMTQGGLPLEFGLKQYDSDFTLIFNLVSKKGEFTIQSGTTAEIRGTKRDGHGYSEDCTISGNAVTVTGDQQMTAAAGIAAFELVLKKGDKELNTATFLIHVERSALDKDTISNSKIRELINVIDRTDEIIAAARQADAAQQSIAELTARSETAATNAESSEQAAEEAAEAAVLAMQTMDATIQARTDQAIAEMDEAHEENMAAMDAQYQEEMAAIQTKGQQIVNITTNAETIAAQALESAQNSENHMAGLDNQMKKIQNDLKNVSIDVDDLGLEQDPDTYYVYPTYKGQRSENGIPLAGGGGGGGGGGDVIDAVLSVENTSGWLSKTIAYGASCPVSFLWSSVEDEMPTGDGTIRITVNNVVRSTQQITQGNVSVDLKPYLGKGTNKVKVRISDTYDQGKTTTFNVTAENFEITSTFDSSQNYTGPIPVSYTPTGAVEKTVYAKVDGVVAATQVTPVSERQMTLTLPAQTHGGHSLQLYFEVNINGEIVRSNELYWEFIYTEQLNDTVIIVSSFNETNVAQYSSIPFPFRVYDPKGPTADVDIYVNDVKVSSQTVDQTEQSYTVRANEAGTLKFKVQCGNVYIEKTVTVDESDIDVEAETQNLALYLAPNYPNAHSNNDPNRDEWTYGEGNNKIECVFSGFNWVRDGWQTDSDGINVLRLEDEARLTIPYKIFERDFKASGKTIEIEFATRQVSDYTAKILSCKADGIGIEVTPQSITFNGAQTEISTLYKDNEHVRLSVVIEKQTSAERLIHLYINGIDSRTKQYATGERFSQLTPVNISIGSSDCGIDIYCIRVYDNDLNRQQVLDNWIADTQVGTVMLERYTHNNVYDAYGAITAANLPRDLPYMIIEADELSQYKGDKKTVSGSYVDPMYPSKSFTFTGCQNNVQGTSSSVYFRKNYDMQFKNGFELATGHANVYALRTGSIPFDRFVLKADVASSEGWNNTGLTMFYNDTCPYKTPEMVANPKVRWGIEGIPIALFWHDTVNGTTQFMGKYNFNLPKRAPEPYGYGDDDTLESWEVQWNNTANVKFQDDDFITQKFDETKQEYYPAWYDDFEARFPSDEWRDITQLKAFVSWVKSTWRDQATGDDLDEDVTYRLNTTITLNAYQEDESYTVEQEMDGGQATGYYNITFTKDTPAYRLTKFRAEFPEWAEVESATFYYLFTDLFLMIDSRAKNMFIGFNGSTVTNSNIPLRRKATFQPYDMDTAIGTNNSGLLMFGYYLEDTDTVSSVISGGDSGGSEAPVFNAQDSVLWSNFRDAFRSECVAMYGTLRSSGAWSYRAVETRAEEHQSKWPEAIFNEDGYIKYQYPVSHPVQEDPETGAMITTTDYLDMQQGSKEQQRKWWLYNRFRNRDSKYLAGDAATNVLSIRLFNSGTITLKPAIDMYASVRFGLGSTPLSKRAYTNESVTFTYDGGASVQEFETAIYSGDMITDVGDLSPFYPNEVKFAYATKLKSLKLGDDDANYSNGNLRSLNVSNSPLLEYINCCNCPNLAITVNLENSPRLREAYFDGSSVTGVDFADGAALETVHLPETITTLTLLNLSKLEELEIPSFEGITRAMIANIDTDLLDPVEMLNDLPANAQVNIQGIDIELADAEEIQDFFDLLATLQGVSREKNASGTWIYHEHAMPVITGQITTETLTGAELAEFNAVYPGLVKPRHTTSYLTLKTWDGSSTVATIACSDGTPTQTLPSVPSRANSADGHYSYTAVGWNTQMDAETNDPTCVQNVTADRTVYAAYSKAVAKYTVTYVRASGDGGGTLYTLSNVDWGTTITAASSYGGLTPTTTQGSATDYPFEGWEPASATVQGNTTFTAKFGSPVEVAEITDSWDTIIANIDNGTYKNVYKIGNYKPLDLGTEGTINMQIVAIDGDELASGGTAPLTFIGMKLLTTTHAMNDTSTTVGGWEATSIRSYLTSTILPLITTASATVKSRLQTVKKTHSTWDGSAYVKNGQNTYDKLWIPSTYEIYGDTTYEDQGPNYTKLYRDDTNRIKTLSDSDSVSDWYLRSVNNATTFKSVFNSGQSGATNTVNQRGIALGFCLGPEPETITDSWSTILANTNPSASYSIGDTKYVDLGTEGKHRMEIVAFDEDDKADGSGKAKITWISKDLLYNSHAMNNENVSGVNWRDSDFRTYLKTLKSFLPSALQSGIVEVTKVSSTYENGAIVVNGQTTTDDLWIPSNHEVGFGTDCESIGAVYDDRFSTANDRIKLRYSATIEGKNATQNWFLRSAHSSRYFKQVTITGNTGSRASDTTASIAFGFCTD